MKFKNANLWFIRNIFTSYKWDKKKKHFFFLFFFWYGRKTAQIKMMMLTEIKRDFNVYANSLLRRETKKRVV